MTLEDEVVKWLNYDTPTRSQVISSRKYDVKLKANAGAATFWTSVTIQFPASIRNDDYKDKQNNTVYHYGWLQADPDQQTSRIDLTSVAANPGNQGGRNPGVPLRPTSPEVTAAQIGLLPSPVLPTPGSGGYRLLAYSPNGTGYVFTAANATGYGLFATSSPDLVEDGSGNWVLDPDTTLNPVYLDGTLVAGAYNGSNNDLVLRTNSGTVATLLAGSAYSAVPASLLTIADGQSVTVAVQDLADGDDLVWLNYRDGDVTRGFVLFPVTSSLPKLTVSDVTVTEGNSGTTNATFTVTLSAAAASNVTVQYATAGGTANFGTDFTATSGTLTFTPGQTSKTVTVAVSGDTTGEPNEDFFLTLSGATNAVVADAVGLGTITNDDGPPVGPPGGGSGPALTVSDVTVAEGNAGSTNAIFTITLSPAATSTVTVDYGTVGGTATSGTDFTATTGTLTFDPGQTTKTVTVAVTGDMIDEPDEEFALMIGATGAAIADGWGLGTIVDDDGLPAVSITDVRQAEGNSGTTAFVFTVTLSHPSWQTITLSFATAAGSATAGTDFAATSGTLTFEPGQTTKTITVTVYGDTAVEGPPSPPGEPPPTEYFAVNLSGVTNATLVDAQGLGLIEDDD